MYPLFLSFGIYQFHRSVFNIRKIIIIVTYPYILKGSQLQTHIPLWSLFFLFADHGYGSADKREHAEQNKCFFFLFTKNNKNCELLIKLFGQGQFWQVTIIYYFNVRLNTRLICIQWNLPKCSPYDEHQSSCPRSVKFCLDQ